jgi:membrane peptidoglycan carboxypeptidase
VVNQGTGTAAQIDGVAVAGKTGTAETGVEGEAPHAWFIAFAPAEDPQVAVAVMVEHGGYGGSTAAPIARKLFDAWLLGKYPEPDPDAIPVTAIGAQAVAAQAAPAPQGAARAAHASVDPVAIAPPRAGTGAGR